MSGVNAEPSVLPVGAAHASEAVPVVVAVTLTVVLCVAEPPGPVQTNVYLVAALSAGVL